MQKNHNLSLDLRPQDFADLPLRWQSEHQAKAPRQYVLADDRLSAPAALHLVRQGVAIIWQGDYHQAKQLLSAMARQIDKSKKRKTLPENLLERFNRHRLAQSQKAQLLSLLLMKVQVEADGTLHVQARRAPNIQAAAQAAWLPQQEDFVVSLRELLGVIGAWEWRQKGVWIASLQERIYPFYGVFSPIRGEYLDLVAQAPLPEPCQRAFDIGAGTGVLSAILAQRGVQEIFATDNSSRAVACSQFNLAHLGFSEQVTVLEQEFFPEGQADLIVCNPPWLPSKSASTLEAAVYDPNSRMLKGFLQGAEKHLTTHGQAWLIISDLAEHLGLRRREELLMWIKEAGLQVVQRYDTKPVHRKASDEGDALHQARSVEVTSLWVLTRATSTKAQTN